VIKLSCKEIEARKELNRKKQDTFTEVLGNKKEKDIHSLCLHYSL
jgi:hypothetical protein